MTLDRFRAARCAPVLLLLALPVAAWAQVTPGATATVPALPVLPVGTAVAEPRWELGAFGFAISQQAYPGADQQIVRALALPYLVYRGPVLRIERGSLGVRAIKRPDFELDVGFSGAFGSRSGEIAARQGMPRLGTLVEFGPRVRWNLGAAPGGGRLHAELPLRGVFDVSRQFSHRGMAIEPELKWEASTDGGWRVGSSVGAVFADRRLAQTFYSVDASEATASRPAYDAQAGLMTLRLGVTLSRKLGTEWRVFGFGRFDTVAGAANRDSPLVRQSSGATVGIGLSYVWLRSDLGATD